MRDRRMDKEEKKKQRENHAFKSCKFPNLTMMIIPPSTFSCLSFPLSDLTGRSISLASSHTPKYPHFHEREERNAYPPFLNSFTVFPFFFYVANLESPF